MAGDELGACAKAAGVGRCQFVGAVGELRGRGKVEGVAGTGRARADRRAAVVNRDGVAWRIAGALQFDCAAIHRLADNRRDRRRGRADHHLGRRRIGACAKAAGIGRRQLVDAVGERRRRRDLEGAAGARLPRADRRAAVVNRDGVARRIAGAGDLHRAAVVRGARLRQARWRCLDDLGDDDLAVASVLAGNRDERGAFVDRPAAATAAAGPATTTAVTAAAATALVGAAAAAAEAATAGGLVTAIAQTATVAAASVSAAAAAVGVHAIMVCTSAAVAFDSGTPTTPKARGASGRATAAARAVIADAGEAIAAVAVAVGAAAAAGNQQRGIGVGAWASRLLKNETAAAAAESTLDRIVGAGAADDDLQRFARRQRERAAHLGAVTTGVTAGIGGTAALRAVSDDLVRAASRGGERCCVASGIVGAHVTRSQASS